MTGSPKSPAGSLRPKLKPAARKSMGRAVFYPPSPSYRITRLSASHPSSPYSHPDHYSYADHSMMTHRHSFHSASPIPSQALGITLGDDLPPASTITRELHSFTFPAPQVQSGNHFDTSVEYGRPGPSDSQEGSYSPSHSLTGQLGDFHFTPGSSSHNTPHLGGSSSHPGLDTPLDPSLVSPAELPLAELIEEQYLEEEPVEIGELFSWSKMAVPRAGPRRSSGSPTASSPTSYLGDRLAATPPSPGYPLPRQMPNQRRFSVPNRIPEREELSASSSSFPQTRLPIHPPQYQHEQFSPRWTFDSQTSTSSQQAFSRDASNDPHGQPIGGRQFETNALNLQGVDAEPAAEHQHENTDDSDDDHIVAARWLDGRELPEEFARRFTIGDVLGSGGFGFVCVGIQTGYDNEPGVEVAIKFIYKHRLSDVDVEQDTGLPMEAFVLSQCNHPNIIGFGSVYEDYDFFYLVEELHGDPWQRAETLETAVQHQVPRSAPQAIVPLPRLEGRSDTFGVPINAVQPVNPIRRPIMGRRGSHDLFEAVENSRFDERTAQHIFRQLVEGVAYLHSRGIYHRDLKDENVVIDRNLHVKIIDFGSAVIEDPYRPQLYSIFRGTKSYAASEVADGNAYYASRGDIWALGIILSILLTGGPPFSNDANARIGRIDLKRYVSADAFDLLSRCLCPIPVHRIGIEGVRYHKWLITPIPADSHLRFQQRRPA